MDISAEDIVYMMKSPLGSAVDIKNISSDGDGGQAAYRNYRHFHTHNWKLLPSFF